MSTMRLPDLPVREALSRLRAALHSEGRAVLMAPPGSGKTTLVPLELLGEEWLGTNRIVMLEPRRLAARASAARMAHLLGQRVGDTVGYQIRFDRKISAGTRIEVVTEGVLTRRLQADPELPGVGLLIFDEFHERSLDADLALALTLEVRAALRPDLRVLVMSATLDGARVAQLLDQAPVVEAAGRMYPVQVTYRPPRAGTTLEDAVGEACLAALHDQPGDVLAFLPGGREIRGAQQRIAARAPPGLNVLPLYGDMPSEAQDEALRPAPPGQRKVILATNIAQTSLTVEGVTAVVDGGWVRVARYDRGSGANRLETVRISRAAADQRAGRAGRLAPGRCYRLWSEEQHSRLPAQDAPEILSADLSRFALELAAWGARAPEPLRFLDLPNPRTWASAVQLLQDLGAVDAEGGITAHGRALARLPANPRLGHMLLRSRDAGLATTGAWVAAFLESGERASSADLGEALRALHAGRTSGPGRHRIRDSVQQLLRLIGASGDALDDAAVGRVVAWAYPERIARRRAERRGIYLCADGGEARLAEADPLAGQAWLAIAHWDPEPPRQIRLAAPLTAEVMEADHAARITVESKLAWDSGAAAVIAEEQRRLGALVLSTRALRDRDPAATGLAMLEGVRALGIDALPWTDGLRQWQARVLSLRQWRPGEDWPDVTDAGLTASMEHWLLPYLGGLGRREHLARLDLNAILQARLDFRQQQRLAALAPTHLPVPSGSRVSLTYAPDGRPPVLAVKLQELFGLTQTPAVNEGRMPVLIHLLSPAGRPLAVTQDLANFWTHVYPEVKREMKGRYPRHPWPEDPLAAVATRRAKPRR